MPVSTVSCVVKMYGVWSPAIEASPPRCWSRTVDASCGSSQGEVVLDHAVLEEGEPPGGWMNSSDRRRADDRARRRARTAGARQLAISSRHCHRAVGDHPVAVALGLRAAPVRRALLEHEPRVDVGVVLRGGAGTGSRRCRRRRGSGPSAPTRRRTSLRSAAARTGAAPADPSWSRGAGRQDGLGRPARARAARAEVPADRPGVRHASTGNVRALEDDVGCTRRRADRWIVRLDGSQTMRCGAACGRRTRVAGLGVQRA